MGQSLQQRLNQLRREKVDMENALEAEQELIVNKLAKEMERLRKQKHLLQRQKTELEAQARCSLARPPTRSSLPSSRPTLDQHLPSPLLPTLPP